MLRRTLLPLAMLALGAISAGEAQETISGKKGDKLTAVDADNTVQAEAKIIKMSQYMRDCKAAGVPLPPVWGDPEWVKKGLLARNRSFDGDYNLTEIWTADSEDGVCFALPRKDGPDALRLLGMICEGQTASKACFWDNIDPSSPTNARIIDADKLDPADMADGYTLNLPTGEQCTECHRGDNVFMIYPGTALVQPKTGVTAAPYKPIVQSGWALNPPRDYALKAGQPGQPSASGGGSGCVACHELPQTTSGYCQSVRGVLTNMIMPADDNVTAKENLWIAYGDDITVLANKCGFTFGKSDFEALWGHQN